MRSKLRILASGIAGVDAADDAIHDAFCRLWSGHRMPADKTEAAKLAYVSVRNAAIDSFRRDRSHRTVDIDEAAYTPETSGDETTNQDEIYKRVVTMSRTVLNERQYDIFRLHDIEGATYDEIAAEKSMTQENVRVTLSRARKILREVYRRTNNDLS